MADGPGGERTERATPRRRIEARGRGEVARSEEVNSTLVLLVGVTMVLLGGGHMAGVLGRNAAYLFGQAHVLRVDNLGGLSALIGGSAEAMLVALAPLLLGVLLAGLGGNLAQVGFHFSLQPLGLNLDRLNPVSGMKRFFNKRAGFTLLKNLFKIGMISLICWATVRGLSGDLSAAGLLSVAGATHLGKVALAKLLYKLLALLAVLALFDWVFQKWQYEENLKMSRVEVKQEHRDLEGDPQIKARIRHIQIQTARRRMLADVRRADVVVTNPDHFAVALRYEPGQPAPRVVAKGRNWLAQVIKRVAREARVPVLENKPLARGLYAGVKVGAFVPERFYQAVAEVLAYVYRLRRA